MRSISIRSLAASAVSLCLASSGGTALAAEKLIYANYLSEVYTASKLDIWAMKELEKRSNGELKFETYWSGSLLKAADLYPGLKSGAADIVLGAPAAYNPREFPLASIMMPFQSTKADAITGAWNEFYRTNAAFRKEFESKNAKVLYAVAWAENTVWSKRPLAKLDDFKGLKVRAVPPIAEALQKMGSTPVALAWPDGLEGLQRGVVDAMSAAPFDSAILGGAQEVAKYGTDAGGMGIFAMAVTAMSLDRYNKLSEPHRKLIDQVSAEAPEVYMKLLNEVIDASVDKLCSSKEKLIVNILPPAEAEKVQKVAAVSLHDDWAKRASKEVKVDGKAMLDEFTALVSKHSKTATYVQGFERYQKKCGS